MFVPGEGPFDAKIMIIGEYIGPEEARTGRNFCGITGDELDGYLERAAISRTQCYITNVIKSRESFEKTPTDAEFAPWWEFIRAEIRAVAPAIIVPLGAHITRFLTGKNITDVQGKHLRITIEDGLTVSVVPNYNPAYGLRETRKMARIQFGFNNVYNVTRGTAMVFRDNETAEVTYEDAKKRGDSWLEFLTLDVFGGYPVIGVDTETVENNELYSVSLSWQEGRALFIMRDDEEAMRYFQHFMSNVVDKIVMHNAKYDYAVLKRAGICVPINKLEDTMILAKFCEYPELGLKPLSYSLLGITMTEFDTLVEQFGEGIAEEYVRRVSNMLWDAVPAISRVELNKKTGQMEYKVKQPTLMHKRAARIVKDHEKYLSGTDPGAQFVNFRDRWNNIKNVEGRALVERVLGRMPEPTVRYVPRENLVSYACADADMTLRIYKILRQEFEKTDQETPYRLDVSMIPMLSDMETRGMLTDPEFVQGKLRDSMLVGLGKTEAKIVLLVGVTNPNSSKQVAQKLYEADVFDTPNESTAKKVLSALRGSHDVIDAIMEYRAMKKLLTTYADTFHKYVRDDKTVHTNFSLVGTETGRLVSYKPNLMNQPTRTELGRSIRDAYHARPGYVLLSTDFSQIEMRVAAHLSGDSLMCQLFSENADIHTQTAARMWNLDPKDVDEKKHRYPAKRVGFGILYGITGKGLWNVFVVEGITGFTVRQCYEMIDSWFEVYSGIYDWVQKTRGFVLRNGYVRDFLGRKRTVFSAWSRIEYVRETGVREAVNMPVQGGAQEIIKLAMLTLTNNPEIGYGDYTFPLLQVHDEIVWEVKEEKVVDVANKIVQVFSSAYPLCVPIKADAEIGYQWGSLHTIGGKK